MGGRIEAATSALALGLGVIGLINVQFAVHDDELYVIEANPRASRTVPFVSKATGVPLARVACRLMLGESLRDLAAELPAPGAGLGHVAVKEAVLPFDRFPQADSLLGPEMKSTGEVMGVAEDYPSAFGKAQIAAGAALPLTGAVFVSVTDADKPIATQLAASLHDLGFTIVATRGTAQAIRRMGVPVERIAKIAEGSPNVVDRIASGDVALVINTPTGSGARADGYEIRRAATARGVPCLTTMTGATAAARAIQAMRRGGARPISLQELHGGARAAAVSDRPEGAEGQPSRAA
jgi:carbamoyl-phosphate synthase large subunit